MAGINRILLVLASAAAALVLVSGVALALPAETPDNTPMVNGPVRAIEQVGNTVWVGGNFSQVQQRNGSVLDGVGGLAVFDSATGQYRDIAPVLSGNVRDIDVYYGTYIAIAGNFAGPSSTQKNLVVVDGATGEVVRWYNAPTLQSVLATPSLGRIYGGGVSLSAFEYGGVKPLWTRAKTAVDASLRPAHPIAAGYRDLEFGGDGQTIWAACACDAIDGQPAKALARLNTEGAYDHTWRVDAGVQGFGISAANHSGALYLGAGGNDFLARYSEADGRREWFRDTSGSVQAVEVMGGGLVVGGHFVEVADNPSDRCGARTSDPHELDPFKECRRRDGLALYSFGGELDFVPPPAERIWGDKPEVGWNPVVSGKYNLAWALHPDDLAPDRLHFGGEFTKVDGAKQTFYARLSEPGFADVNAPVVQAPTHALIAAGSTVNASTVPVRVGWSATDDRGSVVRYELQQSSDGGVTYKNVGLSTPTSTTKTLSLAPGGGHRFRVRATDDTGNTSAWAEGPPLAVDAQQDQSAGVLAYSGNWAEQSLATAFGGTTMRSSEAGAKATFTFEGTEVSWVAQRGPDRGKAEVWLDGTKVQTVDLYVSSAQARRVIYNATSLDPFAAHILEVRVLGTKNAASTGKQVDVDAFVALR